MIKYKDEIMSRPKNEWHKTFKQKKDLKNESHRNLKDIREKFDAQLTQVNKNKQKREKKREEKAAQATSKSKFDSDREGNPVEKSDKKRDMKKPEP